MSREHCWCIENLAGGLILDRLLIWLICTQPEKHVGRALLVFTLHGGCIDGNNRAAVAAEEGDKQQSTATIGQGGLPEDVDILGAGRKGVRSRGKWAAT